METAQMTDNHAVLNAKLHHLLDALADLIGATAQDEAATQGLITTLENDGCIVLAFRPGIGAVEVAIGDASAKQLTTIFRALGAKPAPAGEPIN